MPSCELCGNEGILVEAEIEGVKLDVCYDCSKYGIIVNLKNTAWKARTIKLQPTDLIIDDYAFRIKNKRELMGLTQKELAMKLNEKESILLKIENGGIKPNLDLVKKIQKFLNINLIYKEESSILGIKQKSSKEGMTIGDFIKK